MKELSMNIETGAITDGTNPVTVSELRNLCITGELRKIDHTMMVARFIQYDFDLDGLRQFYRECNES